jgi:hypothetical protein
MLIIDNLVPSKHITISLTAENFGENLNNWKWYDPNSHTMRLVWIKKTYLQLIV